MADPYSAILGTVSEAATGAMSAIPYLVQTGQDKENRKRLKELKRLRDLGALGLTEEEKTQFYNTVNQAAQAARSDILAKSEAATQAYGTSGAGRQLAMAKAGEEALGRAGTQIGSIIKAQDLAREQAMAQELEDRLAAKAERDRQMAAAITSILMPVLGSATESGALQKTTSQKQSAQQPGQPTVVSVEAPQSSVASGESDARMTNPETFKKPTGAEEEDDEELNQYLSNW